MESAQEGRTQKLYAFSSTAFLWHSINQSINQSVNIGTLFFKWMMYLHVAQAVIPTPLVTSDHWMKLKSGWHRKNAYPPHKFPFPAIPVSIFLPLPIYLSWHHSLPFLWVELVYSYSVIGAVPELATRQSAKIPDEKKWEEEWVKKLDFTLAQNAT